ncbi:9560_t:CDS:2 [Racocetra fulgida]|uniref:9560_t:CDS:1 n=1 Tax=Racocetra fulgida TaxID=60492 RepID=A0A9N8VT27_9GLOM|nr:9560_t:CDS:2 [Racocetra fulgida]
MSLTIYQHTERLVHEKTIHLIKYEFEQAPGEPKDEHKLYVQKIWNKGNKEKKLVNLSILKDFDIEGDSVTRLMVEHAKNIVMHNDTPKITNIGMLQAREPHDFKYSPPEILLLQTINDKKKLNIYSLGVLMWEISNDGIEPFSQRGGINLAQLAIQIIKDVRPDCAQITETLKNISLLNPIKIENTAGSRIYEPKPSKNLDFDLACELDYKALSRQRKLRIEFINHFALNRGRNLEELDFSCGGIILRDDGNPKVNKIASSSPVIYLPLNHESPWTDLTNLFEVKNENKMGPKYDVVRIHIPISTVQYEAKPTNEFIQKIRSALNLSDENDKRKALEKWFKHYGNYVVKRATLGGAITVRNWSKVSNESKSYLKSYLQWGIDYGKGASEIFEDVPLDRLPQLEASVEIETIADLYNWFKSLYDLKFAEIISYEEFIPSCELLPQDLQQQLFKLIGSIPTEISRKQLIPDIPSQYDKQDILKWIVLNPPLILHLGDWVRNNELQCGVILQRSNIKHGKKAAYKFLKEPKITEINRVTVLFHQPQTLQDAYLLENGIILKKDDFLGLELDKIPFSENSSILNYPLEDFKHAKNQPSKSIYCQIIVRMAKISFNLADIKSLQEFSNTVNNVLQSNEPYKSLCKVFGDDYGHLLSRTFTLGGILSKKYESYSDTILPQKFEYHINDPQTPEKIVKKLVEWNKEHQHIDTSYFISDSGDLVRCNNIDKWFKDLINRRSDWKVVDSEDWVPLYKILKKARFDIDDIFTKYQIVFNGEESLQKDEQITIIIKFPGSLVNDKYHCFGTIVKRNEDGSWVKIPEVTVRFGYPNKDVAYGSINIVRAQSEISLKSKNLSSNCVLITSIVSKNAFTNGTSFYNIKLKAWTKTKISLELTKDQTKVNQRVDDDGFDDDSSDDDMDNFDSDEIEQSIRETAVLEWCVLYTDGKMVSEADESLKYPWSLFGGNLDPELEILGQDEIDLYESSPRMSLEDAIEQHDKPNGNTLEAGNEKEGGKWIIDAARLGQPRAIEFCINEEINYQ